MQDDPNDEELEEVARTLFAGRPFADARRPKSLRNALLLLKAGSEILAESGVAMMPPGVNLHAAIVHHNETNDESPIAEGSVYNRLWSHPDDFKTDVLAYALYDLFAPNQSPEFEQTIGAVDEILADADTATVESRHQLFRNLARIGGRANADAMDDNEWLARSAMLTSIINQPGMDAAQREILTRAASQAYENATETYADFYRGFLDLLDLRFREDVLGPDLDVEESVELFTLLLYGLAEGLASRRRVDGKRTIQLRTGVDNETEEWDLFGLGFWLMVHGMLEPAASPDSEPNS